MTDSTIGDDYSATTKAHVVAAIERDGDIRGEVRDIVLKALSRRQLDNQALQRTAAAVLEGMMQAAPAGSQHLSQVAKDTVGGLDDAMAKAALSSRLAIEEAIGRTSDFSEVEIRRAIDDLMGIESLFLEALHNLAHAGHGAASSIVKDILAHAERTGTEVSRSVKPSLQALHAHIAGAERPRLPDAGRLMKAGAASLASLASGILAGIADGLAKPQVRGREDEKKGR